jgi:phosphoserine phosphatase
MSFDIVCFDCDSTLSEIEGIDELANRAGCGAAMAALTNAARNL